MKKLLCLLAVLALLARPLRAEAAPQRYLALTFDDGPSKQTRKILASSFWRDWPSGRYTRLFLSALIASRNFRIHFRTLPRPVTRSACTAATMIICRRWTMERRCAI